MRLVNLKTERHIAMDFNSIFKLAVRRKIFQYCAYRYLNFFMKNNTFFTRQFTRFDNLEGK